MIAEFRWAATLKVHGGEGDGKIPKGFSFNVISHQTNHQSSLILIFITSSSKLRQGINASSLRFSLYLITEALYVFSAFVFCWRSDGTKTVIVMRDFLLIWNWLVFDFVIVEINHQIKLLHDCSATSTLGSDKTSKFQLLL